MNYTLAGIDVVLLVEKALWIPSTKTLVIADLHLGKIEHFRSSGIALPSKASLHTLQMLAKLVDDFRPDKVLFLGDLFHSRQNQSFHDFASYLDGVDEVEFILVLGNHDIMSRSTYETLGLSVFDEYFLDTLWLTHEPQMTMRSGFYNLAGHIHPGISLSGKGRQRLSLPCFYFGGYSGVLPAFGYFTGRYMMPMKDNITIFAIAEDKIIHIPKS